MIEGTSTLAADQTDQFWYYTVDPGPVTVGVVGGTPQPATLTPDPNGVSGWRIELDGPAVASPAGSVPLGYGRNPLRVTLSDGSTVPAGSVYVGPPGAFVDIYDPLAYSYITTGTANPTATVPTPVPITVELALLSASELIGALTGVHPAATVVEDFNEATPIHRITVTHQPLTAVDFITRTTSSAYTDAVTTPIPPTAYQRSGQSLIFPPHLWGMGAWLSDAYAYGYGWPGGYGWLYGSQFGACEYRGGNVLQVGYRCGSTITWAARQAILHLARELWLQGTGQPCALPERTTSITREGITMTVMDSQDYLDKGRVGVPAIDMYIASVAPGAGSGRTSSSRPYRRSGIWTPSSPPGVVRSYRTTV